MYVPTALTCPQCQRHVAALPMQRILSQNDRIMYLPHVDEARATVYIENYVADVFRAVTLDAAVTFSKPATKNHTPVGGPPSRLPPDAPATC